MTFFTRLSVETLSPTVVIQKLKREGIGVYHIQNEQKNKLVFSILKKDERKVFAIFEKSCYNVAREKSEGWTRVLIVARQKLGYIVGAICLLSLLLLSRGFVFRIEVSDQMYKRQALSVLAENGVTTYSLYRGDNAYLSAKLLSIPTVTFASVKKEGFCLYVEIKGRRDGTFAKTDKLLSQVDGEIEEMIVLSGSTSLQVGDQVKEGDILVSPQNKLGLPVIPCAKVSILCHARGTKEELLLLTKGEYLSIEQKDGWYEVTFRVVHTINY